VSRANEQLALTYSTRIFAAAAFYVLTGFSSQSWAQQSRGFELPGPETGRRLALVIGNKEYPWKPLTNPVHDAIDVAAALGRVGFNGGDVHPLTNLKEHEMKRAVREFIESIKPGDFAFIYYSGHGVEVKGTNYLLPIDLPADATEGEVEDEAVSAQRITRDLEGQGAAVRVLVLDACRDNPLRATRSSGGGLVAMEGTGSLVVFATEAGRTASDNSQGRNGLFTEYLLKALSEKGVSLDDAIRDAARQMAADTNHRQVPAMYGLLEEPVILDRAPAPTPPQPAPAPDPSLEAWNAIRDSKNAQDYDDFAAAYPNSQYATPARLKANMMRRSTVPSPAVQESRVEALPAPASQSLQETSDTWTDPVTGLMWAVRDNGKDVNLDEAESYCRNLRLEALSDWRLPSFAELEDVLNASRWKTVSQQNNKNAAEIPVNPNLHLSGSPWSNERLKTSPGIHGKSVIYLDGVPAVVKWSSSGVIWQDGDSDFVPFGYKNARALCVRGTSKTKVPSVR
jgi:hypothetical protein